MQEGDFVRLRKTVILRHYIPADSKFRVEQIRDGLVLVSHKSLHVLFWVDARDVIKEFVFR